MSRLNVANFRHPDGTADNISFDSSGGIAGGILINNTGAANSSTTDVVTIDNDNSNTGDNLTTAIAFKRTGNSSSNIYGRIGSVRTGTHNTDLAFSVNDGGTLSEQMRVGSTGLFQFNSGYGSVATAFGARAWIRFDGSAATIGTGVGNGNMDAVTDNGTGDYTVNFTTDMPDANYAIVVTSANTGTSSSWTAGMKAHILNQAAGSCRIIGHHGTDSGEARNTDNVNVVVFR